jgi:hypothetical protein
MTIANYISHGHSNHEEEWRWAYSSSICSPFFADGKEIGTSTVIIVTFVSSPLVVGIILMGTSRMLINVEEIDFIKKCMYSVSCSKEEKRIKHHREKVRKNK